MENKSLTITKIVLLTIIAIFLSIILIILLVKPNSKTDFFKFSTKTELVYEKEITESVKKIAVTTKSADIQLEKSHNNKLEVKYYGEKSDEKDLTLSTNDETLNINEEKSYFCIGICHYAEHKIVISIPEDIDYELDIKTASGDVYIPETKLSNIKIQTVSGDIGIISADTANLSSTSGDIEINEVSKLEAKTVSGEVEVNRITNSCEIKTTSGDVDINILELTSNSKISTISGDVEIDTNISSYVKTETVSGEVDISNNNRYAETELSIKTTSGDIEVGD